MLVQIGAIIYSQIELATFRYLDPRNVTVTLKAISILGVLSLGVGILMISGEFDLSVGAVYTFTGIFMARQVELGMSAYPAALLAIGVGIGIGLLNGFITIRFAIPSFIATLGAMLFWEGMTLYFYGAKRPLRGDESWEQGAGLPEGSDISRGTHPGRDHDVTSSERRATGASASWHLP